MAKRIEIDRVSAMPSPIPSHIFVLRDDECVARLPRAVETRDPKCLQEVAELIGQLAVAVE